MAAMINIVLKVFVVSFVFRCLVNVLYSLGSKLLGIKYDPSRPELF